MMEHVQKLTQYLVCVCVLRGGRRVGNNQYLLLLFLPASVFMSLTWIDV